MFVASMHCHIWTIISVESLLIPFPSKEHNAMLFPTPQSSDWHLALPMNRLHLNENTGTLLRSIALYAYTAASFYSPNEVSQVETSDAVAH